MKWIVPYDQKYNNSLFFSNEEQAPGPRPLYQDLACPKCMKVREAIALERGIDPSFKVRLSGDICSTDDGVYVFSQRTREFFENNKISGLRYVPIPNETRYILAFPTVTVRMPRTFGALRYENPCLECGRWQWIGFGTKPMMLTPPQDDMVVFAPDICFENGLAGHVPLLCSDSVAQLLLDARRRKVLQKFALQDM